jgi:hypothetical protein
MPPARSARTDAKLNFAFPDLQGVTPAHPSYPLTFKAIGASRSASVPFAQGYDVPDTTEGEKGALVLHRLRLLL